MEEGSSKKSVLGASRLVGGLSKLKKGASALTAVAGRRPSNDAAAAVEVDDEDRDEKVMELFRSLELQGGNHSLVLVAVAKGRLVSDWTDAKGRPLDVNVAWYRSGDFGLQQIEGATGPAFQPSPDDFGLHLVAQVMDAKNQSIMSFSTESEDINASAKLMEEATAAVKDELLLVPQMTMIPGLAQENETSEEGVAPGSEEGGSTDVRPVAPRAGEEKQVKLTITAEELHITDLDLDSETEENQGIRVPLNKDFGRVILDPKVGRELTTFFAGRCSKLTLRPRCQ